MLDTDHSMLPGYTVANSSASYYFATDLIHRLYHIPQISDAEVEHYADSYQECLELAANNATWAPYNTHTIQYFVADVSLQARCLSRSRY